MNVKTSKAKKQVNIENETVNLLSKEELNKRIEVIKKVRWYNKVVTPTLE